MARAIPITIRGTPYPSRSAATAALHITNAKLQLALARGTVDALLTLPAVMSVDVRGQHFDTVVECAKYFKIGVSTVYSALRRGYPDGIGLGRGARRKSNAKDT